MTARQREVLEFIRTFGERQGVPPTVREIGERFDFTARAAFDHLRALERKGMLERRVTGKRASRTLVLPAHKGARRSEPATSPGIPLLGRIAAGAPVTAVENHEDTIPLRPEWVGAGSSGDTKQEAAADHAPRLDVRLASQHATPRVDRFARARGRDAPPFFRAEGSTGGDGSAGGSAGRGRHAAGCRVVGRPGRAAGELTSGETQARSGRSQGRTAMKSWRRSPSSAPDLRAWPRMSRARSTGTARFYG